MRVVSWNMAYWKPGAYKAIANRRRQWSLLAALAPDIALLQECRPGDLAEHAAPWMAEQYTIVGSIPERWQACSAILARRDVEPTAFDRSALPEAERGWLTYLSGYVATARVTLSRQEIAVASVHAIANEVSDPSVSDADHERIRRRVLSRAWHNDLAVAALTPWVGDRRFLVGGDWNNAVLFDTTYPYGAEGGAGGSSEFFASRAAHGWHHALRKFSTAEVRTYLDPKSAPYELDHLFTDKELHARLSSCEVLDDTALVELSDHAPLVAEFALE